MSDLRQLPSIDQLLQNPAVEKWIEAYGRPLTVDALRSTLDAIRVRFPETRTIPDQGRILELAHQTLQSWVEPSLVPVINATGVILHTNLGRAPLSRAAIQAMQEIAGGYSNLEYDLGKGRRGSRLVHAEDLLQRLLGVEAALVVNNNAAAVLLALSALARRRSVVIARSQLVEIGGGFRVPDVMKQSGARLVEVGATNRVHLADYQQALQEGSIALFLRAHRSNFRILGFTSEPSLAEIAGLAHEAGIPLIDDLGSGALLNTENYGLGHEPTVFESLQAGADLVCFSGDKLLGGPQAGLIVGKADLIARLRKHPLARAIRADKLCLAALSATITHYVKDEAEREIPIWRMISASMDGLYNRVQRWQADLRCGEIRTSQSTIGGGSLPGETLPTYVLALPVKYPDRISKALRSFSVPIITRVENDSIMLDPRTVLPEQAPILLNGIHSVLSIPGHSSDDPRSIP